MSTCSSRLHITSYLISCLKNLFLLFFLTNPFLLLLLLYKALNVITHCTCFCLLYQTVGSMCTENQCLFCLGWVLVLFSQRAVVREDL